ncbi:MAG: ATP-binding protein [Verrucomicrobiales bacterium]
MWRLLPERTIHQLTTMLLVAALPLIGAYFWATQEAENALTKAERSKLSGMAQVLSVQVGNIMSEVMGNLQPVGSLPMLMPEQPKEQRRKMLLHLQEMFPQYSSLAIYDLQGFAEPDLHTDALAPLNLENDQDLKAAIQFGHPTMSEPELGLSHTDELRLKVFQPLVDAGTNEVKGVLCAELSFEAVWHLLEVASAQTEAEILLIDDLKVFLYANDRKLISERFAEKYDDAVALSDAQTFQDRDGRSLHIVRHAIPPSQTQVGRAWHLLLLVPDSIVSASAAPLHKVTAWVIPFSILLLASVLVIFKFLVSLPIERAAAIARKVSTAEDHRFDQRLTPEGSAEVADLADAFNRMIDRVRAQRDWLNHLVEERTKSLSQAMAQLEAAYGAVREGLLGVDRDGRVIAINQRFRDTFSLPRLAIGDRITGEFIKSMSLRFADPHAFVKDWRRFEACSTESCEGEWTVAVPNQRSLAFYSVPISAESGQTFGRLLVAQDITEKRQLEESLNHALKMDMVGQISGSIAHEFNNLLTIVRGNTALAVANERRRGDDPTMLQYLSAVQTASQAAGTLVRGLLDFSRRDKPVRVICDANGIAREVHRLLRNTLGIDIQVAFEAAENVGHISAVSSQIEQVLINLTMNARDAMPDGGKITLCTSRVTARPPSTAGVAPGDQSPARREVGQWVCLSVQDTGMGMTEETREQIFEPFFTTKEKSRGTGLGLATCRKILQQHGGWITCHSQLGEGSIFECFLPVAAAPSQLAAETDPEVARDTRAREGETLLLVDDEAAVRLVAETILRRKGYRILTASNGVEAMQITRSHPGEIALAMLDLSMPVMSGRETFQALRREFPAIPVVICSGYLLDLGEFEEGAIRRPEGLVEKPFEPEELTKIVRRAIDECASENEIPTIKLTPIEEPFVGA